METSTLSFDASSLISEISPEKSERGPEITLTDSPIVNCARLGTFCATSRCSRGSSRAWGGGSGSGGERLVGGADETRHARRALHDLPGVLVEVHVHQHVAGHGPALDRHLLVVLHLLNGLRRNDDLAHGARLVQG